MGSRLRGRGRPWAQPIARMAAITAVMPPYSAPRDHADACSVLCTAVKEYRCGWDCVSRVALFGLSPMFVRG